MQAVDDVTIAERLSRLSLAAPGHVLCTFGSRGWTVREIDEAANRVANGLLAMGLVAGDRVGLMLPSHPDHVICLFALAKAGLVRVPINTSLIGPSLAYPVEAFKLDALIADAAYDAALAPVLAAQPLRHVFWRGKGAEDPWALERLSGCADPTCPPFPLPDALLAITPSSGTTGAPKGVLKSDRVLRAGPMAILRLTEAKPDETFLFWEALHHGAGVAVLIAAVLGRLTLAMTDRFSASRFWQQAAEAGATRVHYLGSVLSMVMRQPERPGDRAHGVQIAWGGGCPAELWDPVQARFGVQLREGYGLSELTTFCTMNLDGKAGSIGVPLSWFEACVMDAEGSPCLPGTVGELCFRALDRRVGFLGYFRNPDATAATMREGWCRTGDLAWQDDAGDLFYTGRAKDSVRRRGVNISAWEVERVVAEHPEITEVALIGVPSELGEDEIKLMVRMAEGAGLTPEALLAWCRTRLPRFQLPRFIEFVEGFPHTPTQRIRKMELSRDTARCWDAEKAGSAHVA